uniref:alpha-1,2-Mannosidase n=1 Tax=Glossina austeni TaxID=7395 RepID=A0A1A9UF64_GLOAU
MCSSDLGATIVHGLDTLCIMGLDTEYEEGRDLIKHNFILDGISGWLSVFEMNMHFVRSFLILYAFTGDDIYEEKAQEVVDELLPAFRLPTGASYSLIQVENGSSKNYDIDCDKSSILGEVGSLHFEFAYLSHITGSSLCEENCVKKERNCPRDIERSGKIECLSIRLVPQKRIWSAIH